MRRRRSPITHATWADIAVIQLEGDIALSCSRELCERGESLVRDGARALFIDMGRVSSVDTAALNALVAIQDTAAAWGCKMVIRKASFQVLRVMDIAGLLAAFTIEY